METILDNPNDGEIEKYLLKHEKILWSGQPTLKNSISPTKLIAALTLILFCIIVSGFHTYLDNLRYPLWYSIVIVSTVILGRIIKLFNENKSMKNTRYHITKNRLFFELWKDKKKEIHFINYEDIHNMSYEAFENKSGTIFFFLKKPSKFSTEDFKSDDERDHPTFESIPEVEMVMDKIKQLKVEKRGGSVN